MICVYLKIKCTEEIKLIDVLSVALHVILCVFCVAKIYKTKQFNKKIGIISQNKLVSKKKKKMLNLLKLMCKMYDVIRLKTFTPHVRI